MLRGLVKWLSGLLVLVLAGAALTAWLYVRQASPRHAGDLALPGVKTGVTIERDAHGIPSIKAASIRDAMYALGVVHAQDRHWQMETHRRIGSGRMAEAFGEAALENDKFLRALGVKRAAEKLWASLRGDERDWLLAYTQGVNDTWSEHTRARPPEMLVLGLKSEPWTPADSLAWATMMAWDLGGNMNVELLRMRMALVMPVERVEQLIPPYPGDKPLLSTDYAKLYRELKVNSKQVAASIDRVLAAAPPSGIEGSGSNNWVLSGQRTTTGQPLLANDPHLKLTTPALWYFVRLEAPGLKVAGATMPGLPLVVLGQNANVAWGFTNTGPDVQDLYLERVSARDGKAYDTPEGSKPFDVVEETIKVKGKPDVAFHARATRHGPVISDAGTVDDLLGPKEGPNYVIALRWTALDADNAQLSAQLGMMRANSVEQFESAAKQWLAPQQNMVVADKAGHILYVAPAKVPVRGPDHDLKGQVPALGWEARYDWQGTVPVDQLPRELDPVRGWIATANQRIHGADYPHYLTNDWAAPFRQRRIEQLLEAKPKHSAADLVAMQADVKSLAADALLPVLKRAAPAHALAAAAQAQLADFDGTMHANRAAPSLYWAWLRHLTTLVLADEVGESRLELVFGNRQFRDAIEGILLREDAWWCDDKRTPAVETCAAQNNLALERALNELRAFFGSDDVSTWHWGQLHMARAEHRPFSRVKALARWFELRVPTGGDTFTINVSRVNFRADPTTGERYLHEHGPSLRAIYDLQDLSQSRFMHSSGQSGLPWSPQYRDLVEPWSQVRYVPVWPPVGEAPKAVLRLIPSGP